MYKLYVNGSDELYDKLENLDCVIFNDDKGNYIDEERLDTIFEWIVNMIDDIYLVKELLGVNIHTKVEFELDNTIYQRVE